MRIYPSKNSEIYDSLFSGPRPLNKLMNKVFYTDEIIKYFPRPGQPGTDMKLSYKIEVPPNSYDQYKKQLNEKVPSHKEERKYSETVEKISVNERQQHIAQAS